MRKLCLILCCVLSYMTVNGQDSKMVYYAYDNAGNRTARYCVEAIALRSAVVNPQDTTSESSEPELKGKNKYEICDGTTTFNLYPNPTQGNIFFEIVSTDDSYHNAKLKLYNSQGKELLCLSAAHSITNVNMLTYPAGIYVLELEKQDEKRTWKIVKE